MSVPRLILVTVGTDHHPFDRLISWTDEFVLQRPSDDLEYVCQYGTATPSQARCGSEFIRPEMLDSLMHRAAVVVCHGGPTTMIESYRAGRIPIVMPRRHASGEAVDDHQVEFTEFLARRHHVVMVETKEALHRSITDALSNPCSFTPIGEALVADPATVERFAQVVRSIAPPRRGRLLRSHSNGS